jgi:nitrogen PTS system EIIA component
MRIVDFLSSEAIIPSLKAMSQKEVLEELVAPIARAHPNVNIELLIRILNEREGLGSTGIGGGIAIPHGKCDGIDAIKASFGKSIQGIDFNAMDDKPAHLFFLLLAPKHSAGEHLKALARVSRLFRDPIFKSGLQKAESAKEIHHLIEETDMHLP